jgi:hypothetical protein
MRNLFLKKYFIVFSSIFLIIIFTISIIFLFLNKKYYVTKIINDDLEILHEKLARIDEDCNIINITQNPLVLDFFTVRNFQGSVIGGINLAHPKNWKGPYLSQNPTLQGKYYEIIQAKDGLFIIPGKGVKLTNNQIVGKDIMISPSSAIGNMISPQGKLFYKEKPMAKKITFTIGNWSSGPLKKETIHKINKALKEFNNAMSFAMYDSYPLFLS